MFIIDMIYVHPNDGWWVWIWDLWASAILLQWIVYIFRMLQIRSQFRQSKKDGVPIIADKSDQTNTFYQYLFCIPWWATKIDDTAIDLIGKEYRKYIAKNKEDLDTFDDQDEEQTATI